MGDHLKMRRMDRGIQQKHLAVVLGVSPWTLRLWEAGKAKPSIRQWPSIIRFLGYDPFPAPRDFAEFLRAARRRVGCSHRELGLRLGIDASTLAKWEYGKIPRNVSSWQRLEPFFEELDLWLEIRQRL